MKVLSALVVVFCCLVSCHPASDSCNLGRENKIARVSPESQGIDSRNVSDFFDSLLALKTEIHHVMLLRHGRVISEFHPFPFRASDRHPAYSCSKTFVAAAVGMVVAKRLLRLKDRVVKFLPEINNCSDGRLREITVEDLLTMRSGMKVDWTIRLDSMNWVRSYLSRPMASIPGKTFSYDSMNTYLLSVIIQRVTGETVFDYLNKELFSEMGITDAQWEQSPEGVSTGGWGLYLQAESLAKFGQLLLCNGKWNGKQLIPSAWVKKMMKVHVHNYNCDDYCYHMWRCSSIEAVRIDGAYGQCVYILPKEDMVIVLLQCIRDDIKKLELLIKNVLLPGIQTRKLAEGYRYYKLVKYQSECTLPLLVGEKYSGVDIIGKSFLLTPNIMKWSRVRFESFSDGGMELEFEDEYGNVSHISMGFNEWVISTIKSVPIEPRINTINRFSSFTSRFHTGACYAWNK